MASYRRAGTSADGASGNPGCVRWRARTTAYPAKSAAASGFTLIELAVVVFIIGVVMAIAVPRLAPVITFSALEGQARRLANFGRAMIEHATFFQERQVVRIDLDEQEYYAVHWVVPESGASDPSDASDEEDTDHLAKLQDLQRSGELPAGELQKMLAGAQKNQDAFSRVLPGFDPAKADQEMSDKFEAFARAGTEARAANVKLEESFLDVGPLFEDEFELKENEPVEEELKDTVLRRNRIADEVTLESVRVDGETFTEGVAEIEMTPLGLLNECVFYLKNADDDYYTVTWDPVTGGAGVKMGKGEE